MFFGFFFWIKLSVWWVWGEWRGVLPLISSVVKGASRKTLRDLDRWPLECGVQWTAVWFRLEKTKGLGADSVPGATNERVMSRKLCWGLWTWYGSSRRASLPEVVLPLPPIPFPKGWLEYMGHQLWDTSVQRQAVWNQRSKEKFWGVSWMWEISKDDEKDLQRCCKEDVNIEHLP